MKTTIALLLCGILYATASPRCSEEEFSKCNPTKEQLVGDIITEKQLNNMCRYSETVVDCQVDYMDRCPNSPFSSMKEYMKEAQKMHRVFCDKSNPLRKKFLEHPRCLNTFSKEVIHICNHGEILTVNDEASCKKLKSVLKCAEEKVAELCGEDARQVYMVILNPEFQLRTSKCV